GGSPRGQGTGCARPSKESRRKDVALLRLTEGPGKLSPPHLGAARDVAAACLLVELLARLRRGPARPLPLRHGRGLLAEGASGLIRQVGDGALLPGRVDGLAHVPLGGLALLRC